MRSSNVVTALLLLPLLAACQTASSDVDGPAATAADRSQSATEPSAHRSTAQPGRPRPTLRPRGSEDWRSVEDPAGTRPIEAYTTASGALPGTPMEVRVSTRAASYEVSVWRLGHYRGGSGLLVHGPTRHAGRVQPAPVLRPASTGTVVAPWRTDVRIDTTGWEPGFHVVRLVTPAGADTALPYVVTSPSAAGTVALVAPVATWQAYNSWGGWSLYQGPGGSTAHAVSFDRPYAWTMGDANDFRRSTVPAVLLAERLGIPLSYFTNVDLDRDPSVLRGARGYVSTGHDEYWTVGMRRAVERAVAAGTNVAILGANTMYWRVRLGSTATGAGRLMTGYRHDYAADPFTAAGRPDASAQFRDAPHADPEHALLGMQYECYPVDADYVVATPGWWGFAGTGVRRGSRIPHLVGPEADRVYPDRLLPRPLQILSEVDYPCRGVTTQAHSVYVTRPSGAAILNVGTLRWVCALADRCEQDLSASAVRFARTVTSNVLRTYARGPAGRTRPARDNVEAFAPSPVNLVPAS
jgi:hypothetical protein